MKNFTLVIAFLLVCYITNGQCRIGYSFKEIFNEYNGKNKIEKMKVDQDSTLKVTFPETIVYYVCNDKQVCYATFLRPSSILKLDELISDYDKNYKTIVPFIWIAKLGDGHVRIELKSLEEIGTCFMFSAFD